MSIKSFGIALVSLVVVVGCGNTPAPTLPIAITSVTIYDPIIGVNQHGVPVPLGLLEVCPMQGDPYGDALFKGTVQMDCGAHQEVITLH